MRPTVLETNGADANYAMSKCVGLMMTESTTTPVLTTSYNSMVHFREVVAPCCNWLMIHQLDHVAWIAPSRVVQQKPVTACHMLWESRVDLRAPLAHCQVNIWLYQPGD